MRRFIILAALCLAGLPAGTARAGQTAGAPMPLQVYLRREEAPFADPRYTALITMATMANNKFAFLVPQGFSMRGDPATGILTLSTWQGNRSITFAVLDAQSSDSPTLGADDYRDVVMREYPTATIVKEFTRGAGGGSGPGFDLQWKTSGSVVECKRVMFISSPMGVLEFTGTTTQGNFDALKSSLDGLLMTFRYSTDGVLKVRPLPSNS